MPKKIDPKAIDRAMNLVRAGYSDAAVAEKTKLSKSSVRKHRLERDVERGEQHPDEDEKPEEPEVEEGLELTDWETELGPTDLGAGSTLHVFKKADAWGELYLSIVLGPGGRAAIDITRDQGPA